MAIKPIHQKIFEKAKPFLHTRKNLIHTQIALRYALKLLKSEKGDEEVVIPAILLHDVGWNVIPEHLHLTAFGPNPSNPKLARVHEVEGAKIAKAILEKLHYPPDKRKRDLPNHPRTRFEKEDPSLGMTELLRMRIN